MRVEILILWRPICKSKVRERSLRSVVYICVVQHRFPYRINSCRICPIALDLQGGPQKTEAAGSGAFAGPQLVRGWSQLALCCLGLGAHPQPSLCAVGHRAGLRLVPEAPHPPGATWLLQPRLVSLLMQLPNSLAQ